MLKLVNVVLCFILHGEVCVCIQYIVKMSRMFLIDDTERDDLKDASRAGSIARPRTWVNDVGIHVHRDRHARLRREPL